MHLPVIALFGLLAGLLSAPALPAQAQDQTQPGLADTAQRTIGDADAPVEVLEFSSLTCPHCAAFHAETLPDFKERFIDTGQVRLVLRDFPLDSRALDAAALAHCAGPRYVPLVDVLFQQQSQWARAQDHIAELTKLAALGGMGPQQVRACLSDQALKDSILQERLEAQQEYAIRSTPSFVIDGEVYAGNRSVEDFAAIIEPLTQ